uniref:Uncharacterized protein n=1 Tax=Pelusios castaneus TaxID=367368 RepID=A0A8C8RHT7_9SAUR
MAWEQRDEKVRTLPHHLKAHLQENHRICKPNGELRKCSYKHQTWVPWNFPGDSVVSVEQLPPQELVPGHCMPLPTHQSHRKHVRVVQVQENLIQDAVWEKGTTPNIHSVILPPKGAENKQGRIWCLLITEGTNLPL